MSTGVDGRANVRLHLLMAAVCGSLLAISAVGAWLTRTPGPYDSLAPLVVLTAASFLPALLWHDRRQYEKRDAALTLPWTIALCFFIPYLVVVSARLRFPLHDAAYTSMDNALGFSVPAIMAATSDWLRALLRHSYNSLYILLPTAALVPALAGRKKAAEEFLLSNAIAFLIALPLFTLFPAIGPWAGYHFPATSMQTACQQSILALHGNSDIGGTGEIGIVCLPSFHVIWALLSAFGLRCFKPLRFPAAILAALIIASTVTTGWHYGVDVIAGIVVSVVAIVAASSTNHKNQWLNGSR